MNRTDPLPPEWRAKMQAYQNRMVAMQAKGQAAPMSPPEAEDSPTPVPPAPDVTPDEAQRVPFLLRQEPEQVPAPPQGGQGRLQVRAFTAEGALPIADALVRVYLHRGSTDTLQYAVTTDADGLSPLLYLPGQDAALTQTPDSPVPSEDVWVLVEKAGYYSQLHQHIVLYAGLQSRQSVGLVPLPEGVSEAPVQVFDSQRPNL